MRYSYQAEDRDGYSGNTAYWFFALFWQKDGSKIKTRHIYKAKTPAHIFIKIFGYSGRHGDDKVVKT